MLDFYRRRLTPFIARFGCNPSRRLPVVFCMDHA
jgi:hypothetical protein